MQPVRCPPIHHLLPPLSLTPGMFHPQSATLFDSHLLSPRVCVHVVASDLSYELLVSGFHPRAITLRCIHIVRHLQQPLRRREGFRPSERDRQQRERETWTSVEVIVYGQQTCSCSSICSMSCRRRSAPSSSQRSVHVVTPVNSSLPSQQSAHTTCQITAPRPNTAGCQSPQKPSLTREE